MALLEQSAWSTRVWCDALWHSRLSRLILLLAILTALSPAAWAQESADEYQVKAAYLHNFGRFVQWPAAAFPTPVSPLVIGVVGNDPSGGTLDGVLRGKSANGHPIQLRHLRWDEPLTGCHILFISSSESEHL